MRNVTDFKKKNKYYYWGKEIWYQQVQTHKVSGQIILLFYFFHKNEVIAEHCSSYENSRAT